MTNRTMARMQLAARRLEEACESGAVPGAVVAVAVGGVTVLEEAYGFADTASGTRVGAETPFSLASLTKPLVGTALAVLAARGVVDLDAPVRRYWPILAGDMTVRQIANHSGGLPPFVKYRTADDGDADAEREVLLRYARPVSAPGLRHLYSNLGYGLLGAAVEEATGDPLPELLEELVLQPLKMGSFRFAVPDGGPGAAVRYAKSGAGYPPYTTVHGAASDGWCSVRDLLRFGIAHASGTNALPRTALTESRLATMWSGDAGYGIGWGSGRFGESLVAHHSGNMPGVAAHLAVVPEAGVAIALLANTESDLLVPVAHEILAALVAGFAIPTDPAPGGGFDAHLPAVPPDALAGRWAGTVRYPSGPVAVSLTLRADGSGRLDLPDSEHPVAELHATERSVRAGLTGRMTAPDLADYPHVPQFGLHRADRDTLSGGLVATGQPDSRHPRPTDLISWPMTLRRTTG